MIFGLLATQVPPERRSTTLNLVYLPLYAAGIVGPAIGGVVVQAGIPAPFLVGAGALAIATVVVARSRTSVTRASPEAASQAGP
jgi:MFS family permease